MRLKEIIRKSAQKKRQDAIDAGLFPEPEPEPMAGDLQTDLKPFDAIKEHAALSNDVLPSVNPKDTQALPRPDSLQGFIRSNLKIMEPKTGLDLLYLSENPKDALNRSFKMLGKQNGAFRYECIKIEKQGPQAISPILSRGRTMHGAQFWRNNPFSNVLNVLYCDPKNALPLCIQATNPTINLFVAFTKPPHRENVFEAICQFADVLFLPRGIFVSNTLLGKAKRIEYFSSPEELTSLVKALSMQRKWAIKGKTPPLIQTYTRSGFDGLMNSPVLPTANPDQEAVIYLPKSAIEQEGLCDCRNFIEMMTLMCPHVDALYIREDIVLKYNSYLPNKSLQEMLIHLLHEGLRIDTRIAGQDY